MADEKAKRNGLSAACRAVELARARLECEDRRAEHALGTAGVNQR